MQNEFLKSRKLRLPAEDLPEDVEEALEIARKNNFQLQTLEDAVSLSKASLSQIKADQIWPKIDFTVDKSFKENVGGTRGKAQEYVAKLQFTYNFNLGFSAVNNIDAARANYLAAQKQLDDARRLIDEAVRNAFIAYKQALQNAILLREQADLSKAFLELARKERKLGKRSLLWRFYREKQPKLTPDPTVLRQMVQEFPLHWHCFQRWGCSCQNIWH